MLIANADAIERFVGRHRETQAWLNAWTAVVEAAQWQSLQDVRRQYPSADGVKISGGVVTVFNVKGNQYRVLTRIAYSQQLVVVQDLLTHAQYSRNKWK